MNEEKKRILKMVEEGKLTVDEALTLLDEIQKAQATMEVGSKPCRSVSQGVGLASCLPKTAWPPT